MIDTKRSQLLSAIHSRKIDWPESEISLSVPERNRLFLPEIVFESRYLFDVIRKHLTQQSDNAGYEGYRLSLIAANQFPYANGKYQNQYFYRGITGMTKMIDLSDIIEFRKELTDKIFWMVPTANKEFNSNGCNLYSNHPARDLTLAEDFARQMETIAKSITQKEESARQFDRITTVANAETATQQFRAS